MTDILGRKTPHAQQMREAANHIERLEKENAELRALHRFAVHMWETFEARALAAEQDDRGLTAVRALYDAYVRQLEVVHNWTIFIGGHSDPVDRLEAIDPALAAAREAIAVLERGRKSA